MKKGMLVGLVLGLVVASGAALGALRNGNPAPVEADSLAGEVVYVKLNANWKTNSPRFAAYAFVSADTTQSLWVDMSLTANETDIYQAFIQDVAAFDTVIFCRMDPTKTENNWDNKWNQTGDLTYTASLGPLYTLTEGSWDSGTWGAYDGLPFEVDEYPVIDGTFTPSEMRVEYASATKPFTPTNSPRKGFVFEGWFRDKACTSAYTPEVIFGQGQIYGKYTTADQEIYVTFGAVSWTDLYVYTFGNCETMGPFPGTKIAADMCLTANLLYEGKPLYTIPIATGVNAADDQVIFSDYDGTSKIKQTADLVLREGAYYTEAAAAGDSGDLTLGEGAATASAIAAYVNQAADESVCTLLKEDCDIILNLYDPMDAAAKAAVDRATLHTWKDKGLVVADKKDVPLSALLAQIRAISASSGTGGLAPRESASDSSASASLIAMVSFGLLAFGLARLGLRRRKRD